MFILQERLKYLLEVVPYTALYRINNGTLPTGTLVDENCATIQQDVRIIFPLIMKRSFHCVVF